jgi:hypothetical protein
MFGQHGKVTLVPGIVFAQGPACSFSLQQPPECRFVCQPWQLPIQGWVYGGTLRFLACVSVCPPRLRDLGEGTDICRALTLSYIDYLAHLSLGPSLKVFFF